MKLIWLEGARQDLRGILDYISDFNDDAADRLQAAAERCAERLVDFPFLFEAGRIGGTREALFHPNYIMIYRVTADAVEIVNVIHARQQYP